MYVTFEEIGLLDNKGFINVDKFNAVADLIDSRFDLLTDDILYNFRWKADIELRKREEIAYIKSLPTIEAVTKYEEEHLGSVVYREDVCYWDACSARLRELDPERFS